MFKVVCLSFAVLLCAGCERTQSRVAANAAEVVPQISEAQLLDDMSGIWRGMEQGSLVYLLHEADRFRMFIGDNELPVALGSIDPEQETVNLTLAQDGGGDKEVVWTLRRRFEKEQRGFYLMLTLNDGEQATLGFVRKVSREDLRRLEQAGPATLEPSVLGSLLASGEAWTVSDNEADEAEDGPHDVGGKQGGESSSDGGGDSRGEEVVAVGPFHGTSFDCTKAEHPAESMVCLTGELAELDLRLSRAYRAAVARSDQPEAERSTQMRWLADQRNACGAAVACLRTAYRKRLKYFEGPPHYTYSEHAE